MEKNIGVATAWLLFAWVLMAACVLHPESTIANPTMPVQVSTTMLMEIFGFTVLALYFYKPTMIIGLATLIAATSWLINQMTWGWFFVDGWSWRLFDAASAPTVMSITAILNFSVLALALAAIFLRRGEEEDVGFGTIGVFILLVMVSIKVYLDVAYVIPTGATWALSGGIWATGILITAVTSILACLGLSDKLPIRWLPYIGLIIAAYGALTYGQALTLAV